MEKKQEERQQVAEAQRLGTKNVFRRLPAAHDRFFFANIARSTTKDTALYYYDRHSAYGVTYSPFYGQRGFGRVLARFATCYLCYIALV